MHSHDAESACWISWASTSWSKSLSSWMNVRHEQGVIPFPLSQCWNMARQQASLVKWSALMSDNFEPLSSKSSWSPRRSQNGATLSMMSIFFPSTFFNMASLARVGLASKSIVHVKRFMLTTVIQHYSFCRNWFSLPRLESLWETVVVDDGSSWWAAAATIATV